MKREPCHTADRPPQGGADAELSSGVDARAARVRSHGHLGRQSGLVGLLVALATTTAHAHGADANQIQLVLHEGVAEVVATPPADFPGLRFADDDADGRLSRPEMDRHRAEVRDVLTAAISVVDEAGRAPRLDRADVSLPVTPTTPGVEGRDFVRLTLRLEFDAEPKALRVICRFVGEHPVMLLAHRADGRGEPGRLGLKGPPQVARFDADHPEAVVLGEAAPVPAPAPQPEPTWLERAAPFIIPLALLALGLAPWLRRRVRRSTRSSRP
jgi:hypothetical protein